MKGKKCTKEKLTKDYLQVKEKLGHHPSLREYTKHGKFSQTVFYNHFVSWGNFTLQMGGEIQKGGTKRLSDYGINNPIYNKYFKIYSKDALVLFDPHIPLHSIVIMNEVIDIAQKLGIRKLIIGGDTLDFKGLYKKKPQQSKTDWVDDINIALKNVFTVLVEYFDEIYIFGGNHDQERLEKLLGSSEQATKLLKLIFENSQIKYSEYQHCLLNDTWMIMHEGNSKVKLSKLEKIVSVNRKPAMAGHSHRFAFGVHDSGIEPLCEGLHATDPDLHEYVNLKRGDFSKWISGFWIIKNNKVLPYIKHPLIYNPFLDGVL